MEYPIIARVKNGKILASLAMTSVSCLLVLAMQTSKSSLCYFGAIQSIYTFQIKIKITPFLSYNPRKPGTPLVLFQE